MAEVDESQAVIEETVPDEMLSNDEIPTHVYLEPEGVDNDDTFGEISCQEGQEESFIDSNNLLKKQNRTPRNFSDTPKAHWTEAATYSLIAAIKETRLGGLADGARKMPRHHFVSAQVEKMLRSQGYTFSLIQIKNKWKKLKQRYYKKAMDIRRLGTMGRDWPYYDSMTEILDCVDGTDRAPSGLELDAADKDYGEEEYVEEEQSWTEEPFHGITTNLETATAVALRSLKNNQSKLASQNDFTPSYASELNFRIDPTTPAKGEDWNFRSVFDVERGCSFQTRTLGNSFNNEASQMLKIFLVIPNTEIRIPMSFLSTTTMRSVLDQAIAKYNVPKENYLSRRENGEDTYDQKQTLEELGIRDNDKLYVISRIQFWLQSGRRKIVAQCEENKKIKDFLMDVVQRFSITFNIFLSWTEDGRCHLQDNTTLKGAGIKKNSTLFVCKEP